MGMNGRLLRPLATGFTPRSISGLAAWWDASDAASITTVSGAVSQWNDKSGNGVHATQTTANNRPVNTSQTLNGRAVMTFDGSNDIMSFTGTARTDETQFVVVRNNMVASAVSTQQIVGSGASGYGLAATIKNDGSVNSDLWAYCGGFVVGTTTARYSFSANNPFGPAVVAAIRSSASGGILRTDGVQRATCTTSNSYALASIGGAGASFPLNGYIAEIVVYSRALSVAEVQRVERYLGAKWGITLAPQVANADAQDWVNRVYANGGTVSSATANAVNMFCNAIDAAGIRDRFYRLNLFCGTGLPACLVPLYRGASLGGTQYGNTTDTNQNFVGGDYSESGGLTSNAASTKALATGVMPMESGSPLFNYGHYFAHVIALPTARSSVMGVRKDPAPANRHAFQLDSTGRIWGDWCHQNRFNGVASGVSAGKTIILQAAQVANATQVYASGSLTLTGAIGTFTGTASQGAAIFAARGDFGSGFQTSDFSTMTIGAYSIGLDFTAAQALAYHTAYAALAAALGRTIA